MAASPVWMTWAQVPWLQRTAEHSGLLQLCDRIARMANQSDDPHAFLHEALTETGTELSLDWSAICHRPPSHSTPQWVCRAKQGPVPADSLPSSLLSDVLDRDAAVFDASGDVPLSAVPLATNPVSIWMAAGARLTAAQLPELLALSRVIGVSLALTERADRSARQSGRLQETLAVVASISRERETQTLLERLAEEATRLVDCDRASIFIWDREHQQVIACPALGVEGGQLRLPDDQGIVGEVLRAKQTIHVADAYADDRFNQQVDKQSGYKTNNLVCVPLLDQSGDCIGAFEAINKNDGRFDEVDVQSVIDLGTQAAVAVQNTREREQLLRSNQQLTEQLTGRVRIIGQSEATQALRSTITRLAATDLPVLILGESGTGKEVAAQALHYQGTRAEQPFIAVNCAALTETLLESELFGHEKGAFTDAHDTRAGKFELAEGGTLFLDEIGDMSPGGQAKLLRVLEQKVVTRVGGSQAIPINVRVIAATNTKLAEAVQNKKFREDLYYRLSVVTLDLLALRERPADIMPLVEFFLSGFCEQARRKPLAISAEAKRRLQAHAWPGNVRELRNLMERVAFLAPGDRVEADDIAFILSPNRDSFDDLADDVGLMEATNRFQQEYIRRAVKRVQGNMSEAARLLGLHRSNLYRKMKQLEMDVDDV